MKRIFTVVFVIFSIAVSAQESDSYDVMFQNGLEAYRNQMYNDAMNSFSSIIESGFESGEVYYNMGNTAYKLNDYPAAILYYEKAKLLIPNDEDLQKNLKLLDARIIDKIDILPELFYVKWWHSFKSMLTPNQWSVASIGAFVLVLALALLFFFTRTASIKKSCFWMGVVVFVFFVLSTSLSYHQYKQSTDHNYAIIFTPSVTAKSSPTEESIDVFVVHEGTKVEIADRIGEWNRVRLANGSIGWMKSEAMKVI